MEAVINALASGKGGTGKTVLSTFIGGALARLGKKVVLIELDSGMRSIDIVAGVSGLTVFDIEDVLSGRSAPGRAVVQSPHYEGLSIIAAPYENKRINIENLRLLCDRLRTVYDCVLLDVGGRGAAFDAAAKVAQRTIMVVTPDPVTLRDARVMVDTLPESEAGNRLILNRVQPQHVLNDGAIADLDEAIDMVGLQLLGVVPESGPIYKAASTGEALPAGSREMAVFTAIAQRMMGEDVPLVIS